MATVELLCVTSLSVRETAFASKMTRLVSDSKADRPAHAARHLQFCNLYGGTGPKSPGGACRA